MTVPCPEQINSNLWTLTRRCLRSWRFVLSVCDIESTFPIGPYFSQYLPLLVLALIQYDQGFSMTTDW